MPAREKTYTELKDELDALLDWFESSDVDVDEALVKYDQAAKLITELEKKLADAELVVKKLSKKT
ncbi:MAG: exodeoxyribonuclease VII small subunit [Patescibacteria group bacterium]